MPWPSDALFVKVATAWSSPALALTSSKKLLAPGWPVMLTIPVVNTSSLSSPPKLVEASVVRLPTNVNWSWTMVFPRNNTSLALSRNVALPATVKPSKLVASKTFMLPELVRSPSNVAVEATSSAAPVKDPRVVKFPVLGETWN